MINDASTFTQRAYVKNLGNDRLLGFLQTKWVKEPTEWNVSFYLGPKEPSAISPVDPRLESILDYGWLSWLAKLILRILNWLNEFVKNYGLAIILFTLLFKLIFLPFTWRTEGAMKDPKKSADLQHKLKLIEQKYKDDQERQMREKAELMKKHMFGGGLGSCLPMLLPLPVFFALLSVLRVSIELYEVPFLWIPNLAARDPYYILPILVAVALVFHMPSNKSSKDPKSALMPYVFGIGLGAVMVNFAAGVVLYTLTSTVLGVLQARLYKYLHRS